MAEYRRLFEYGLIIVRLLLAGWLAKAEDGATAAHACAVDKIASAANAYFTIFLFSLFNISQVPCQRVCMGLMSNMLGRQPRAQLYVAKMQNVQLMSTPKGVGIGTCRS
mmetsp:Transcript_39912/g.96067  ORF Transcript_39912/g.96067 Transcript_39912/m.96067 type:complete len:109 (-) Transcript_39912:105-431(-)